jgi:hypothetical protein
VITGSIINRSITGVYSRGMEGSAGCLSSPQQQMQPEREMMGEKVLAQPDAMDCILVPPLDTEAVQVMGQAARFHNDGFLKLCDVFDLEELRRLHDVAMNNYYEVMSLIKGNGLEIGIGIKNGYKDIVQRHPHRFEMPYKMDSEEFSVITRNEHIMGLVKEILGDDATVINKSLLISLPGAEDQAWHTDGPHVNVVKYMPCHCLNVFVPLVDVDMTNGPTEFRPESQVITRDLSKQFLAAFMSKKLRTPTAPCINVGSAVMVSVLICADVHRLS